MALIIEDGSIVTGANSYISTTNFTAYATARGLTITGDEEQLLIQAMDYIESQSYKGIKSTRDQALQWPRVGVYVDGYYLDSDTIPQQLINGQCEVALSIDAGTGPLADVSRQTKREKVDVLEVEYSDSSAPYVINRKIRNALWKLLIGGNSGNVVVVGKG